MSQCQFIIITGSTNPYTESLIQLLTQTYPNVQFGHIREKILILHPLGEGILLQQPARQLPSSVYHYLLILNSSIDTRWLTPILFNLTTSYSVVIAGPEEARWTKLISGAKYTIRLTGDGSWSPCQVIDKKYRIRSVTLPIRVLILHATPIKDSVFDQLVDLSESSYPIEYYSLAPSSELPPRVLSFGRWNDREEFQKQCTVSGIDFAIHLEKVNDFFPWPLSWIQELGIPLLIGSANSDGIWSEYQSTYPLSPANPGKQLLELQQYYASGILSTAVVSKLDSNFDRILGFTEYKGIKTHKFGYHLLHPEKTLDTELSALSWVIPRWMKKYYPKDSRKRIVIDRSSGSIDAAVSSSASGERGVDDAVFSAGLALLIASDFTANDLIYSNLDNKYKRHNLLYNGNKAIEEGPYPTTDSVALVIFDKLDDKLREIIRRNQPLLMTSENQVLEEYRFYKDGPVHFGTPSDAVPADFDWQHYLKSHSDLAAVFKTKEQAVNHWKTYGHKEGRIYRKEGNTTMTYLTE